MHTCLIMRLICPILAHHILYTPYLQIKHKPLALSGQNWQTDAFFSRNWFDMQTMSLSLPLSGLILQMTN